MLSRLTKSPLAECIHTEPLLLEKVVAPESDLIGFTTGQGGKTCAKMHCTQTCRQCLISRKNISLFTTGTLIASFVSIPYHLSWVIATQKKGKERGGESIFHTQLQNYMLC